ncbi:MAG: DUF1573 domain-containing protein [Pirellulales bacterium]
MKPLLFLLGMTLIGAIGGAAWTWAELGHYGSTPPGIGLDLPTVADTPLPQVEIVDGSTYDFGTMNFGSKLKHAFRIKNVGSAPLKLVVAGTSCRCTLAELPNNELPPGGETGVELEWKATEKHGPYSQTATLETNDPRQPRIILGVNGKVVGSYLVDGGEVIFTKVPYDKSASGDFRIFAYTKEPLPLPLDIAWKNPEIAQYYNVEFQPLTAEQLQRDNAPRSGYKGVVTVLPGQAVGDFRQTLEFTLDLPDRPRVSVEVRGSVAGRGSISGTMNWDAENKIYELGRIPRGKAARSEGLTLIVRGDQRETLKLSAGELSPKYLYAEFGGAAILGRSRSNPCPADGHCSGRRAGRVAHGPRKRHAGSHGDRPGLTGSTAVAAGDSLLDRITLQNPIRALQYQRPHDQARAHKCEQQAERLDLAGQLRLDYAERFQRRRDDK